MTRRKPARQRRPQALGEIWIGDVARAWQLLGATATEREWIAETLGFAYKERQPIDPSPAIVVQRPLTVEPRVPAPGHEPTIEHRDDRAAPTAAVDRSLALPLRLTTSPRDPGENKTSWATVVEPLAKEEAHHLTFRPAPVSLLQPEWTRAIVGAATASRIEGGPIDIERMIDAVCRARPIRELPRSAVWTMRQGVQILLDRGSGMMPFARDGRLLAESIRKVAGHRTPLHDFFDCPESAPERGREIRRRGVTPYATPAPGTTVVVISDLGLSRGASTRRGASARDWLAFSSRVRASGCSLIAFVPCAPSRWPRAFTRSFQMIPWDRSTTVGTARRVARGEQP